MRNHKRERKVYFRLYVAQKKKLTKKLIITSDSKISLNSDTIFSKKFFLQYVVNSIKTKIVLVNHENCMLFYDIAHYTCLMTMFNTIVFLNEQGLDLF